MCTFIQKNFNSQTINELNANQSGVIDLKIENSDLSLITTAGLKDVSETDIREWVPKTFYPYSVIEKVKPKLWGLLNGLEIDEEDIEEAKKSLFPDRF